MLRRVLQRVSNSIKIHSNAVCTNRLSFIGVLNSDKKYQRHSYNSSYGFQKNSFLLSATLFSWLGINKDEDNENDKVGIIDKKDQQPDQEIIDTIKLGILAKLNGDYDKAQTILHIALKMAQDMDHFDAVSYIYNLLADMAFDKGDYMQAEKLFKDLIQRQLSKGVEQNDNSIIEMSLKLACIYGIWKQHEKAKIGYLYCIKTQENKLKSESDTTEDTVVLWGMSKDLYAQYLLDNGRYEEAFSQFQEAFLTSCELFGDTHSQSLILLNSLGTVCSLMGDDVKAVSYFTKAVALARSTECEDLPSFMVNLGMAKIKLGLKTDANAICEDALMIGKRYQMSEVCLEAQECLKLAGSI